MFLGSLFKYDASNRASIFGSFTRSNSGSKLLWELFDEQAESLLEEFTKDDLKMIFVQLGRRGVTKQRTLDMLSDALSI